VQGRGALKKELTAHLRSGRTRRRAQGRTSVPGQFSGTVLIRERPPEVEDRAVPGHWEGDLIVGKDKLMVGKDKQSAIGTLVERQTRYLMLLRLPNGKTAEHVCNTLTKRILDLPASLRRTLTWDRGKEMAEHQKLTIDTGVQIYFCDPYSPWQRGSNERTNDLLCQYLPKGTDLSTHDQAKLDQVAYVLNSRPRMTLSWRTPGEAYAAAVALTD
jgi:IS30 family transposase